MHKFRFDKLIRDKIPDDQRSYGDILELRVLDDAEYIVALKQKIIEESQEIDATNREEAVKELADLQEVLDCLAEALGTDKTEIARIQTVKRDKVGSYKERQYIETIEVSDSDPYIKYYLANPDRFPEVK
jgi:predicted house-cleaning noncanonical NTP pyrophosphatase (MazG superfamily)